MSRSVAEQLQRARAQLRRAGIATPELDAAALLEAVTGVDRLQQITDPARRLSGTQIAVFTSLIARRAAHHPVSRLIGRREFWSLNFEISPAVLDPRPDSETLVDAALAWLNGRPPSRILDLGTGSGCLLLAILSERPDDTGLGVDISESALAVARRNAEALGAAARVSFQQGDWCEGLPSNRFDLVISNPPYIVTEDIPALAPEVRDHDPHQALDGGADGLTAYRMLVEQVPRVLRPGGQIIFELGIGQADAVEALLADAGAQAVEKRRDLAGRIRCICATFVEGS
ncbi:MAG: peptide chain release factor N(5)-glutamine methyltransferase [Alphaproteobacteria bacterium]